LTDPPTPEADALEQAQPVRPDAEPEAEPPHTGPEIPEADALEQAEEVPLDDEEEDR
jgi:hypothetical protein